MAAPRNRQQHNPPARNQTSTAGDFTGKERARLMEEHSEEVAEAQERVGLMNATEAAAEEHGIFDAATQEVVGGFEGIAEEPEAESVLFEEDGEVYDPSEAQTKPLDPMKDMQEPVTQQKPAVVGENPYEIPEEAPRKDRATIVESPVVVFRVNSDIEEMTFGRELHTDHEGNQIIGELRMLSFYRGRRYKAPREIFDHLESKGLIFH